VSDKERPPPTERAGVQHDEVWLVESLQATTFPVKPLVQKFLWWGSDTKFCVEQQAIPQTYLQNNPHFSPTPRLRARIKPRNAA
jgi:hypothetical protein